MVRVSLALAKRIDPRAIGHPLVGDLSPIVPESRRVDIAVEDLFSRALIEEVVTAAALARTHPVFLHPKRGAIRFTGGNMLEGMNVPLLRDFARLNMKRIVLAHAVSCRSRVVDTPLAPLVTGGGDLDRGRLRLEGRVVERRAIRQLPLSRACRTGHHKWGREHLLGLNMLLVVHAHTTSRAQLALGRVSPCVGRLSPLMGRRISACDLDDLRLKRLVVKGRGVGHGSVLRARGA